METTTSRKLFDQARRVIPGGVNSPVRAFKAVGGIPRFLVRGEGCRVYDADGNAYVDYVGSWGPLILGHAHPSVIAAVQEVAARGTSFGAPTELEVRLAEQICRLVPSVEMVRLVNSGTEATMTALRLARGCTGRDLVVKFEGCYHGHADSFLVKAGSGVATLGIPGTPGVPAAVADLTVTLPFNDREALEAVFAEHGPRIAAVICEPVTGNMGVVVPPREYLARMIELAEKHGALAIFDEVMTGFRLALGGAQELFGLRPHLTCLGKIVGGGLPLGAVGGRAEVMRALAPEGPIYQAGTLSGNPLAVTAGLKTLELLEADPPYRRLEERTGRLCEAVAEAAAEAGVPVQVPRCGSMFTVYFTDSPVRDFASASRCDTARFARFFQEMLERGVYLAPSQFEACFLSVAHDEEALEATVLAAREAFRACAD
ncbi:MAG: glutamate-1-semialdehyde 2,1-aminomutase [Acidobacteriota bacterium]